jgi:selenocysteine lyase/cysteine desulfurase
MDTFELREQLPVLENVLYANSAAGTPCPDQVLTSMAECLRKHATEAPKNNGLYHSVEQTKTEARNKLASFLNAKSHEIALTQSTADSVTRLATSLPWEAGDVVAHTDIEHPASYLPFQRIQEIEDINITVIPTTGGHIDLNKLHNIAKDAKLVMIDSITWTHGTKPSISDIANVVHDAGALLLVDAVQSVGQTNVDISTWNADFVAGASHKWLLGPWGAGFLFVREGLDELIRPHGISHWSVMDKWDSDYTLKSGAQKLEVGGASPAPYAGVVTAIDLIETVGIDNVESHIRDLSQHLKRGIDSEYICSPNEFESGIVTVSPPNGKQVAENMSHQGMIVRDLPLTKNAIRISLHIFNTMTEVDALIGAIEE